MPGYRLSLVQKEVDPRYFCVHCLLLLKDAMITGCGHFYCESCVELLFRNPGAIPTCKACENGEGINKERIIPDKNTRQEVLAFVCACTFCNEGCPWIGQVRHYEHHAAMCDFYQVKCENRQCNVLVRKADLSNHMTQTCKYRPVDCSFCDRKIPHNLLKTHIEWEHGVQLQGDPGGGLGQEINSSVNVVNAHEQSDRQNVPNSIRNAKDVADLQEEVRKLQDRLDSLLENLLENCQAELLRSRHEVQQLQNQVSLLENRHVESENRHQAELQRLQNQVNLLVSRQVELLRLHDEKNMELYLDRNERENAQRRMELRIQSIEHAPTLRQQEFSRNNASYDGIMLWKISEFSRLRNEAVSGQRLSIWSTCFYTGRFGYKMCTRVFLNGDGSGQGTHISVFFVIMRGQYDAFLRWPFRQKVTFMLLDQDNVEHVIDAFRPDPSSSSFQRPRRERNIASGCPTFCSLTELNNHAYVRDDAMFLKVIVDTSDL